MAEYMLVGGELYHYGVKGMKWGVRRYQNYDGSYTKRGLERYYKAESDYDKARADSKNIAEAYKRGAATKQQYRDAKRQTRLSKNRLKDSYEQLKTDKLADEGKKLYKQGKTITDNMTKNVIAQTAVVVGSRVATTILASSVGNTNIARVGGAIIGVGGTAVNAVLATKTHFDNKKLRAYYGH